MFKALMIALLLGSTSALAQQSPPLLLRFNDQADSTTLQSADQQNLQPSQAVSLLCVLVMTSHTGTVDVSYKIQGKVPELDLYFDLMESLTAAADNVPVVTIMGPGVENTAKLNKALPVPPIWRLSLLFGKQGQMIGTATGQVSCRVR